MYIVAIANTDIHVKFLFTLMFKKIEELTYFKHLTNPVYQIVAIATAVFFSFSGLRHALFKSNAYDLGIFDQAIYLISQGLTPISSLMGFHILGDHASWIFYILALPYKVYPTVYWLLLIQALAFALVGLFHCGI